MIFSAVLRLPSDISVLMNFVTRALLARLISLADSQWLHGTPTRANLSKIIAKGLPDKGMPGWDGALDKDRLDRALAGETLPGELVIVDQSRDDRTMRVVAEAAWDRIVPVTYIHQDGAGIAVSRNAAIAHASKPIVVFTDDDCVPDARWVEVAEREHAAVAGPLLSSTGSGSSLLGAAGGSA